MNENDRSSEKSTLSHLAVLEDPRALVRLIQCRQCSRPLHNPVTLPCGNAICRECLPETHQREGITYPDLPGRRQGIICPFSTCSAEHPVSDCNVDVISAKLTDMIARVVAQELSLTDALPTIVTEVERPYVETDEASAEKPRSFEMLGGRLIATYMLAAQRHLLYGTDIVYGSGEEISDSERLKDEKVLGAILEATQREVDCQVCYNLMLDPVTTFCGHTLCRKCMARVLDHSQHCPVCRRGLALPPSLMRQPSNRTISDFLNALCPDIVAVRASAVAAEDGVGEGELDTPLFICTLGFPNQPTFLRIFEPRYRLMLRRCMEGRREFGMLMYNRYGEPQGDLGMVHFYHYGTMLRVVHAQMLPDGTSLVETQGAYRFRVKAHGVLDGYSVGSVERIEDLTLAEEERIEAEETSRPPAPEGDVAGQIDRMPTRELLRLGLTFIERMQARSERWLQQRTLDIHGQLPNDAALFPYWFASVLPISDEEKYKLLGTRTVRERLKITATWVKRIESQRWADEDND